MTLDRPTRLRDLAAQRNFYIGAAVNTGAFLAGETMYREMLKRECNVLVAENMMKYVELSPSPNTYSWGSADALVEFAEVNGQKLRGHTLVWHQQLPPWLTSGTWTSQQAEQLLEQHIKTVAGRYRGRIWAWDVVNEAIADAGGYRTDSFWYRHIGPQYLAMAFRWAHEADPNAMLYYNDYDAEGLSPKSDSVYELVRDLKRAGVPIHGVGWQMHLCEGWRVTAEHRENAERLRDLGLELSMTELDVRLVTPSSRAQLESQAASYGDALELALETCAAVLMWGLTDKYSWIPSFQPGWGAALPFDANYKPKPAYIALQRVLAGVDGGSSLHIGS